jgi:hypothetical protein
MEVQSNMAKASVLQQLKTKEIDVAAAAERLVANPGEIPELVEALQAEKGSAKYRYEKALRLVSERRPELIYPYFDAFAALLGHENNFLKWGAIMTVANLTAADIHKERLRDRYVRAISPYDLALEFIMERVLHCLERRQQRVLPLIAVFCMRATRDKRRPPRFRTGHGSRATRHAAPRRSRFTLHAPRVLRPGPPATQVESRSQGLCP